MLALPCLALAWLGWPWDALGPSGPAAQASHGPAGHAEQSGPREAMGPVGVGPNGAGPELTHVQLLGWAGYL